MQTEWISYWGGATPCNFISQIRSPCSETLSDTTVNLTAFSKFIKLLLVRHFKQHKNAAEKTWMVAVETIQQLVLETQPELQAIPDSFQTLSSSLHYMCQLGLFIFLLRWLLHLPACRDAVKLILVSCLMAVTQVTPAHWGAEFPQHWPLAIALMALNGSWQPSILWNGLLHDYYGNTGH